MVLMWKCFWRPGVHMLCSIVKIYAIFIIGITQCHLVSYNLYTTYLECENGEQHS